MASGNSNEMNKKDFLEMDSFFWSPAYLEPSAWIEHLPFAFWLIENLRPGTVVELGVYNGTSYFSFCQAIDRLDLSTKSFAIDTWQGDEHAGFYSDAVYDKVNSYNKDHYAKFSTLIRSTFDEARRYFEDGTVDLLHIDGLHTYEAVKHDFETWLPALSPNAIVVFHDINVREREFGVFRFWNELKAKYDHFEFDFGSGLGIIALGTGYNDFLRSLFKDNKSAVHYSFLRNFFAERGQFFQKTLEVFFIKDDLAVSRKSLEQMALSQEKPKDISIENNLYRRKNVRLQVFLDRRQDQLKELEAKLNELNGELKNAKEAAKKSELMMGQLQFTNFIMKEELHAHAQAALARPERPAFSQSRHDTIDTQNSYEESSGSGVINTNPVDFPALGNVQELTIVHEEEGITHSSNDEFQVTTKAAPVMSQTDPPVSQKTFGKQFFSALPFFMRKNLLLMRWAMQGTKEKNKYRLEFLKKHRHVPHDLVDEYMAIDASALFDRNWYLAKYPDVKDDNADPILHYLLHGYKEGRDPGQSFSTNKYYQHYADIKDEGINPLVHYIFHGKREGRTAFITERGGYSFPYPVVPAGLVQSNLADSGESATTTQIIKPMQTAEPDFLQRRAQTKDRKDITAIKTVAFIAQPEYFSFHYEKVLEDLYSVRYFSNSFSEDPAFFKDLVEFDADINIFFRGEIVPQTVLESLSGIRVNLSSEPFPKIIDRAVKYTQDSLDRFEFFLRIFDRSYDYIFHYDEVSKNFFEAQGIELSGYFPFPVATELIKPATTEKKWDLFFSGRSTPHRDKFFGPLKRDFNFLHINHGVVGADLLDFIHKSKISVNIHAENELSWEPRTQFLVAAGSLLVSEPLSPTSSFRPGIDFIEINDPWGMYETCRNILANYDAYRHIAESGRKRVEMALSSRKTFPVFFNELLMGKYKSASFNKNRVALQPLKTNLRYNGFEHLLAEYLNEHA